MIRTRGQRVAEPEVVGVEVLAEGLAVVAGGLAEVDAVGSEVAADVVAVDYHHS